jgi:hypothetical protein
MTFIYRFVCSIPYHHPVCLDGYVKIFVSWMASLSRAPDQHQVPAQVLPSSRSRVAISSPGLSVWFPVPPSLSLSRSNELISALLSLCVRRQIHQVPAQVLLSTPSPSTSSVRRDLVRGSFDLVLAFGFALAFSALVSLFGARSTKCQRRCFFLPHLPGRRRFVAISSAGLSIWFSLSRSARSARSSRCVLGARSTKCQRRCFFLPHLPRRRRFVAIWFPFLPSPSLAVGHRQIKRRPSTTPRQPPPPSPHLPGPCSVAVAIRSQLSQLAIKPARN